MKLNKLTNRARLTPLTAGICSVVLLTSVLKAAPQSYATERDGDVVRLHDASAQTRVSLITSVGNIAFEMNVKGQNVLYWPYASIEEFRARPAMSGIPFLGPWADRLDEQAFFANGRRYAFDMQLGNVRGEMPIHGFVTTTDRWSVVDAKADSDSAWVTSRLEFYRQPMWMKQWPFAHTIEITHRLHEGVLEVETTIVNMSADPMPIAIGFHPYFQLTDAPRDEWKLAVGARTHWRMGEHTIPTGESEPIERFFPKANAVPLSDYGLDDVFTDLVRNEQGTATISVTGKSQRLDISLGANYRSVTLWSPKDRPFICVEPTAGIINGLNLAARGVYKELQTVAAGRVWRERFWVKPSGF